jgi:rfaE bifunctional protein nucleotidyltransferase chain/domain
MFNLSKEAKTFLSNNKEKKIVFTNGCFDLIHSGHITYLTEARALGDILFVGINSDKSVKQLKGPSRPINNQDERKFILQSLRCVDFVEIFNEETPYELIKVVRPKILVKGGDWKVDQIVGHDIVTAYGGKVLSLTFLPGLSTTATIEKIQGNS